MSDPIRVLYVHDHPDFADVVVSFLEREDERFGVETATGTSEGLERLADGEFHCVVSDYEMPGRDGIEFLQAVRETDPDLPFVLYTGKGSEDVAGEAISAGVTEYLQKGGGTDQYAVLAERIESAVEQHRSRRELEESQQRLSLFFEQSPLGVIEWNEDFEVVRLNPAAESILGYAEPELEGRSWAAIVPDTGREDVGEVVSGLLENEDGFHSINENVRGNGERIVCEWHNRVVTDDRGDVVAVFSQFRNVTGRTERERELLRTSRAVDEAPVGISVSDPSVADNPLIYVNGTFEELTGYDAEAVLGRNCRFLQGEDTDPETVAEIREAIDDREPVSVELLNYRADGTPFWNRVTIAPVEDESGTVTNFVGFQEDVTERIERERELERYETIVQTVTDPVYVLDAGGRFVRVNDAMVETSGYPREELLGSHASMLVEERDVRRGEELIRALLAGERDHASLEVSFRTADGSRRQYSVGMAILLEDGRFEGTVVVAHDVTDLREYQRRLSVLDRVLRHNLRNKMNVALGNAQGLASADDPSVAERAASIREAAEELLCLSESARRFEGVFQAHAGASETVDVAALVGNVVAEARLSHPEADISTVVPDEAPARVHETFELALEELVENAVVHSDREQPRVEVTVGVDDADVEVCVADDGPGLGETDRRALRRGTESPLEHTQGLGLWLVRWSAESVGGEVEFAENDPRGTVVTVRLPRAAG
jgi:PAS domain S-box-containing protein